MMVGITFVPAWVIPDALILISAAIAVVYILKHEERPIYTLLEFACFVLLNAAVFENFATLMGWYGYGHSIIMIFNVPITIPIIEYLVVYTTLRLLDTMEVPTWCKPILVGFSGMLFDFTLDPVAVRLIYPTAEGTIARWSWYISPTDVNIYGVPVYNFSGWVLLCGYGAAFLLLGRHWFKKSRYSEKVGYAYPILAMLGALLLLMTPLSNFLLWMEPLYTKGSTAEWVMLGVNFAVPLLLLALVWKGKMKRRLSFREEYLAPIILIGFHLLDLAYALVFSYIDLLPLEIVFTAIPAGLIYLVYLRGGGQQTRKS
jgi:hypothetical protein